MRKLILLVVMVLLFSASAAAAYDAQLQWYVSKGATGYKVSMSTDQGQTWTEKDAGNSLSNCNGLGTATSCGNYIWVGAPDTGLVIWKIGAYNAFGLVYLTQTGAWFNGSWQLPVMPAGLSGK